MKFIQADWPAPTQIKAYTTTRSGWNGKYPNTHPEVRSNEEAALRTIFDVPQEVVWLNQVHGNKVVDADPNQQEQMADASYTEENNRACLILTADCLPIFICNKTATHVAAIHAGWRGLAAGVIENTVRSLNIPASDLLVWLGPAIGPQKFEVGLDVFDAFTKTDPAAASAFKPTHEGKWLADLYALARLHLSLLGIEQVYGGGYCTHTQNELFFSYRRDQGKTGRMASLIWIERK